MLTLVTGALVLLSWFGEPVHGEISSNFQNCLKFFYEDTIPEGISGEGICQVYKNEYRFATLYDKTRRIPLYSAYILKKPAHKRPEDEEWKIEPQLASSTHGKEMEYQKTPDQNVKDSQAVEEDYRGSIYQNGHLNPSSHQYTEDDQRATFTLTNIVPQRSGSNNGPWSTLEQEMLETLKKCKSSMYVITGVIPHESDKPKINERVHVPEYLWTAYCCQSLDQADENHFLTFAAVGRNNQDSPEDIVGKKPEVEKNPKLRPEQKGFDVKQMSLEDLEEILEKRLKKPINLFKNKCK